MVVGILCKMQKNTVDLFPVSLVGEQTWLTGQKLELLWQQEVARMQAFLKSGRPACINSRALPAIS